MPSLCRRFCAGHRESVSRLHSPGSPCQTGVLAGLQTEEQGSQDLSGGCWAWQVMLLSAQRQGVAHSLTPLDSDTTLWACKLRAVRAGPALCQNVDAEVDQERFLECANGHVPASGAWA